MKFTLATISILIATQAQAECYGSGAFKQCWDDAGNSYSVETYGNSTYMRGQNAGTGATWSQSSETYGNSTFTRGVAADGGAWNMTQNSYGAGLSISGTDSQGNGFSTFCYAGICQ